MKVIYWFTVRWTSKEHGVHEEEIGVSGTTHEDVARAILADDLKRNYAPGGAVVKVERKEI